MFWTRQYLICVVIHSFLRKDLLQSLQSEWVLDLLLFLSLLHGNSGPQCWTTSIMYFYNPISPFHLQISFRSHTFWLFSFFPIKSSVRFYCVAVMSFAFGCTGCDYSGGVANTQRWSLLITNLFKSQTCDVFTKRREQATLLQINLAQYLGLTWTFVSMHLKLAKSKDHTSVYILQVVDFYFLFYVSI